MIRAILDWLFPYDPDPMMAPDGVIKEKKKGKGGKNEGSLYLDSQGHAFKKDEDSDAHIAWTQTDKKKQGVTIPASTKQEVKRVNEENLNQDKYEELRAHFFLGHKPYGIAKEYAKNKIDGYSKSTVYPYFNVWREFHRPIRPKK